MIALSPEAAMAIKSAIVRRGLESAGLRIMIESGGCAGHKYLVGLETTPQPDDAVVECEGVTIFVDPLSRPLVQGLRVEFVESLEGAGFTFSNPNARATCSCGKSFG